MMHFCSKKSAYGICSLQNLPMGFAGPEPAEVGKVDGAGDVAEIHEDAWCVAIARMSNSTTTRCYRRVRGPDFEFYTV